MILNGVAAILVFFVTQSRSSPIIVDTPSSSGINHKPSSADNGLTETEKNTPEIIGSALAPVVGAVVGPLLINIANGITNGITTSIVHGYEPLNYGYNPEILTGSFDAYLVTYNSKPYILLNSVGGKRHDQANNNHAAATDDEDDLEYAYYGGASYYNFRNNEDKLHQEQHDVLTYEDDKKLRLRPQIIDSRR